MPSPLHRSALAPNATLAISPVAASQDVPDKQRVLFEVQPAALGSTSVQLTKLHGRTPHLCAIVCFDSPPVAMAVTDETGAARVGISHSRFSR